MSGVTSIGLLAYHHCSEQDTVTVWEILRGTQYVLEQEGKKLDLHMLAMEDGLVEMQFGTRVEPTGLLGDDIFDLLYVPGGTGTGDASSNERILETVRRHHEKGKILASNCSGPAILQRAGVLGDRPITCTAAIARKLRMEGANVPEPRRMWLGLPEEKLWTTVGASGVNASTIALCAHYFARDVATKLGMMFDTYGQLGEQIYSLEGPEYYTHEHVESDFQDFWEDQLLPSKPASPGMTAG